MRAASYHYSIHSTKHSHSATTEVVALENTLNGTIFPQDEIIRIADYVHEHGLKLHLDGARIWHVAAETGLSISELCAPFDSVSLCLSKGLGACSPPPIRMPFL